MFMLGLSGDVKRNTEIETIPTWGPLFRVSFDLKINSQVSSNNGWASVLSFKGNEGATDRSKYGDRIPAIFLHKKGFLHFTSGVNGNRNHAFNFNSIKLNKWYSITIQQTLEKGKVGRMKRNGRKAKKEEGKV